MYLRAVCIAMSAHESPKHCYENSRMLLRESFGAFEKWVEIFYATDNVKVVIVFG